MMKNPFQVVRLSWQVFDLHLSYCSHLEFSLLVLKYCKNCPKKSQNIKIKRKFPNPFISLKHIDEYTVTFFPLVFYVSDSMKVNSKNLYFKICSRQSNLTYIIQAFGRESSYFSIFYKEENLNREKVNDLFKATQLILAVCSSDFKTCKDYVTSSQINILGAHRRQHPFHRAPLVKIGIDY